MGQIIRMLALLAVLFLPAGLMLGCSQNERKTVRVESEQREGEVQESGQGREMIVEP